MVSMLPIPKTDDSRTEIGRVAAGVWRKSSNQIQMDGSVGEQGTKDGDGGGRREKKEDENKGDADGFVDTSGERDALSGLGKKVLWGEQTIWRFDYAGSGPLDDN